MLKKSKINILLFTTFYAPKLGGLEKNVSELSIRLSEQEDVRVEVVACNTEHVESFVEDGDLTIHRIRCWNILKKTYAIPHPIDLFKVIRNLKNKPDVVLTATRFFTTSLIGALYSKFKRIPTIHIEYGSGFVPHPSAAIRFASWLYDQTFGRLTLVLSDFTFGISEDSEKFSQSLGAKNTGVFIQGLDVTSWSITEDLKNNTPQLRTHYVTSPKSKILLSVGRIIEEKGFGILVKALSDIDEDFVLLIVGDGPYVDELVDLVGGYGMENRVMFLGRRTMEEVKELMAISDIYLSPSYCKEGMQNTRVEAAAMENIIISTNVGGTGEIISDGYSGVIVEPANVVDMREKISAVLNDFEKYQYMGARARERVLQRFDWDVLIPIFHSQVREIINKKGRNNV